MYRPLLIMIAMCLALATALPGCAHQDAAVQQNAERKLEDYRLVASLLSKHDKAPLVQRDLTRVNTWMRRAEVMLNDEDRDDKTLKLLLSTIEGQLIQVRSALSRLEAEATLEQERQAYEQRALELKKRQATAESSKKEQPK